MSQANTSVEPIVGGLTVKSYFLKRGDVLEVTLDCVMRPDGPDRWAIRKGGFCLNKHLEWEYEPMPSSRDDAFFSRCRFDTIAEAMELWGRYR